MTDTPHDSNDDKYITFKRDEFFQMMGQLGLPPWKDPATGSLFATDMDCTPFVADIGREVDKLAIKDAVIIRRQDLFASPCLFTYASMIALVADNISDQEQGKELLAIADYFQRQAEIAATESWKLPDR